MPDRAVRRALATADRVRHATVVLASSRLGSGTVGGGSLLEIRDATLGRYLEPGDEVALHLERLGTLRNPIVARPK